MDFVQQARGVIIVQKGDFMYNDTDDNYYSDMGIEAPELLEKYDHRTYISGERHTLNNNDGTVMDSGPIPWLEGDEIIGSVEDLLEAKKDREEKAEKDKRVVEEDEQKRLQNDRVREAEEAHLAERARPKSVDELKQYAAAVRYRKQINGFVSDNYGNMLTDLGTTTTLSGLVIAIEQGMIALPINFKSPRGWVQMDEQTIKGVARETTLFIQKCFNTESDISELIDQGSITTQDQIDEAFV